jgi:uncharacterized delta-60 repeat protein
VAVDGSGNVFVTGSSANGYYYDYATVAYSPAGIPLWTNRYNGPAHETDVAVAVAVDAGGNVFVTGYSFYVSGGAAVYATIKYSGSGMPLWTNFGATPGCGCNNFATAMAVDSTGDVIVTGHALGVGSGSEDYVTIKYSGTGVPLWTNLYNGPGNTADYAYAIAVDSSGNVFVTGYSYAQFDASKHYATVGYSSAGVPIWTNLYNGPGNQDLAYAIAVDDSGSVVVTGESDGIVSGFDYVTIKYSASGVPLWINRYNGPSNGDDHAKALAVDSSGNVFVTGSSSNASSGLDWVTVAYSADGGPLWTNRYNGPGNGEDRASAIAVDSRGNVSVTGSSTGIATDLDYATVAYSGAGAPLWTNYYNGPGNGSDVAAAMTVDPSGNVLVTGASYANTNNPSPDFATIKYSPSVAPVNLTITPDGGSGYFIRFNGIAGSTYRLQRATRLAGPWVASAPLTAPASGIVEFHDLFPPASQAFYRTVQP